METPLFTNEGLKDLMTFDQGKAENELGNTLSAKNYLNLIRRRAGLEDASQQSQADLWTAIALERRLELTGEGQRWFDLLRTGTALSVMNAWFAEQCRTMRITAQNLLQPISQDQIDTDPSIKQNP
jgi:hypothetical protein